MIDTRFPPQPHTIIVPLYPQITMGYGKSVSISETIASHYKVKEEKIFLCNRGSTALFVFLSWLRNQYSSSKRIALPAFCCPEVCQSIILSGFDPVFLDLTNALSISRESLNFAVKSGCCALIWPQLFQERSLSEDVIKAIKESGLLLINDEAQLFPHFSPNESNAPITLFSFGHSKRLAASGGGGFCVHDKTINLEEIRNIFRQLSSKNFTNEELKAKKLETCLDILLEKEPFIKRSIRCEPISYNQELVIQSCIEGYQNQKNRFQTDILDLKDLVPSDYLSLINSNNPSVFALRVPANNRYEIGSRLASFGIQTTWYYFPLNRLSFLQSYLSEKTENTDNLSSEILILPFQWRHSNYQKEKLLYALRKTFG